MSVSAPMASCPDHAALRTTAKRTLDAVRSRERPAEPGLVVEFADGELATLYREVSTFIRDLTSGQTQRWNEVNATKARAISAVLHDREVPDPIGREGANTKVATRPRSSGIDRLSVSGRSGSLTVRSPPAHTAGSTGRSPVRQTERTTGRSRAIVDATRSPIPVRYATERL